MAEQNRVEASAGHGTAMALAIWGIVLLSVIFYFRYSVPELASDRAAQDTLYNVIMWITGVLFIVVQVLLGYFIFRYRHRDDAKGLYWHDSHKMEVGWTLGTAAVLVPIVFSGLVIWNDVKASAADLPSDAVVIEAVGAQFQWDFRYPGPDGEIGDYDPELYSLENPLGVANDAASADDFIRTNQLVLPVDRVARILLRSKDVQHAFFLPNFRVKQDLMPGMRTSVTFTPTKVGEYEIACAELCGLGHYRMRAFLTVMTESDYQSWLQEQAAQN